MRKKIVPPSRKEIWKMFDQISATYDLANRAMTFGIDQLWRKQMCAYLPMKEQLSVLDCATGTGDQIITMLKKNAQISSVIGIDLAEAMIDLAKEKLKKEKDANKVSFLTASALEIPFPEKQFDAVTISFGIRNVTDVPCALREFHRVLKSQGKLLILEGTVPEQKLWRSCHLFYLRHILPRIGGVISKNRYAYRYLNETIETFPQGETFCKLMKQAGFGQVKAHPLLGGVVTIYEGEKDAPC